MAIARKHAVSLRPSLLRISFRLRNHKVCLGLLTLEQNRNILTATFSSFGCARAGVRAAGGDVWAGGGGLSNGGAGGDAPSFDKLRTRDRQALDDDDCYLC